MDVPADIVPANLIAYARRTLIVDAAARLQAAQVGGPQRLDLVKGRREGGRGGGWRPPRLVARSVSTYIGLRGAVVDPMHACSVLACLAGVGGRCGG